MFRRSAKVRTLPGTEMPGMALLLQDTSMTVRRNSVPQQIRERLLEQIARHALRPGDRLVEAKIAEEMGTSSIPVREAIRELVAMRILESAPHRGAWVRQVSLQETIEAFEIRASLEPLAAEPAAQKLKGKCSSMRRTVRAIVAAARKADFAELVRCVSLIGPDRVQLNTVTRPPAESFAIGISRERLTELAGAFDPPAEVIADFRDVHGLAEFAAGREDVLALLRRRPCSMDDIAGGLGMHRNEVVKYVEHLNAEGLLLQTQTAGRLHYRAAQ